MSESRSLFPLVMVVLVAVGCGGGTPQDAAATTDAQAGERRLQLAQAPEGGATAGGTATLTGSVRFEGTAPEAAIIKMDADPACQQQHTSPVFSEEVVVNGNGTLKNVLVYVKEGAKGSFAAPSAPVILNQAGCWYQPHVFGLQTNQPLEIVNSDATLHNVNAKPASNQPFNIAQPVKGMRTTKKFVKPEAGVKFKCNVHPWMSAYAVVVEHPFFSVSDEAGVFTINGLPAGTYVIEAWHEQYGSQTQTVSVGEGETKSLGFLFKAP